MTEAIIRCPWPGLADPIYQRYHDEEWGVPVLDGPALFERLTLEAFQSGLSWLTILKKRHNFRRAFDHFEPAKIATYKNRDVARLMADTGIVRNAAKINATIANARAYLNLEKELPFADFLWAFAPVGRVSKGGAIQAQTDASKALAKALKMRGFGFVGPTTAYAMMQATGMVNDHVPDCHSFAACEKLQSQVRR